MKILVLTVSDRAFQGVYEDKSGPAIEGIILEMYPDAVVSREVVPDEKPAIMDAFRKNADRDFIITTGGTGLSPRDVTPEATVEYCDRLLPGIAETLRRESCAQTPNAMLSRATAGQKDRTVIVNMPGSVRGAQLCTRVIGPALSHAVKMISGGDH